MPFLIDWKEIAFRLALTVIACGILGWERGETKRAAGLRTIMIVGITACVSMIQTNLLLTTVGKTPESFAVADVLRLPLGILTGVGFLGAGAILRRDDRIVGLTTAASLWLVTTIGLCFGGGQSLLGISATAIALIILHGLKVIDDQRHLDRLIRLRITCDMAAFSDGRLQEKLIGGGTTISAWHVKDNLQAQTTEIACRVNWRTTPHNFSLPDHVGAIRDEPGVISFEWSL